MSKANTPRSKTLYAVIIGINAYPRIPLYGCVNDALDVHEFCRQLVAANDDISHYEPKLLLAPHKSEDRDALKKFRLGKDDYDEPTRANIIAAFDHFKAASDEREDICLVYYSGHGSFQGAPKLFWDLKSGRQVETLVCVDSRQPGGRDLMDKELAYLIYNAIHDKTSYEQDKPGVHTLMIMDCCHSGDNTRGVPKPKAILERMEQPNPTRTPLTDYHGYPKSMEKSSSVEKDKRFMEALKIWRSARYVHLAAARDKETAKETLLEDRSSGVFTYSLLKTLRSGGMQLSYAELIERVKIMVRNRVDEQIPSVFANEDADTQLTFMGGNLKAPVNEYVVYYDVNEEEWMMDAGANAGMVASGGNDEKTKVAVWRKDKPDQLKETEIIKVASTRSVLDGSPFSSDDEDYEGWTGKVTRMVAPSISVGFDDTVGETEKKYFKDQEKLEENPAYQFVDDPDTADYLMYQIDGEFVLGKGAGLVPVFRRTRKADKFLTALHRVGKWVQVLELNNRNTDIRRDEVTVHVEVIEGQILNKENLNTVSSGKYLTDPSEIKVSYKTVDKKDRQPAIKVRLNTKNESYYLACLFMDSRYGINSNLRSTQVGPGENGEWLRLNISGKEYETIPLDLDKKYHKLGITEITDYLKIFVSREEFPIKRWEQAELELDDKLIDPRKGGRKRGAGLEEESTEDPSDWMCFTIPIRISRPLSGQEQPVDGNNSVSLGGARISVPQGFSAKVSAASAAEVEDMVRHADSAAKDRSMSEEAARKLQNTLLPPSLLWGATPSRNGVFSRGVSAAAPDTQLSILEFTATNEENTLINRENPILFEPEDGIAEDEVLIPFAFDEESGMYLPMGFSDDEGKVHIENLPKPTPGKIVGDEAINTRSVSGSIKLFFKKVVIGRITGQTNNNRLAICSVDEDGISQATLVGKDELASPDLKNICLLIHGIIGDTEIQRQAFFEREIKLSERFDAVISYDYENLNTPIEETAKLLKSDLAKAGITEAGGKRLTIVAHSMGGLVSRWFIEQEGGNQVVSRLIQLGTPNGGSEISDFRKSVFSMMSMAMNGAAFLKPYLPVLSFIGKKVTKALFHTLNQMSPTESKFLPELNGGTNGKVEVPYVVIGGDTGEIKPDIQEDDPLWKQFWKAVKKKGKYALLDKVVFKSDDPNDMAVTQASMQQVPTQDSLPFHSVASDHISYFCLDEPMDKLQEIIGNV